MTNQKKTKRRPKPFILFLLCLIFTGGIVFFVYNIIKEGVTTYTLTVDINEAKKELAALEAENSSLADQKDKLQDVNYVENYARGEYMITKKGEAIYHLPSTNTPNEE